MWTGSFWTDTALVKDEMLLMYILFSFAPSAVETLHAFLNSGVGGAGCSIPVGLTGGSMGAVSLPRRAETFGGFDSHQMNSSKSKTHEFINV